MFCRRAWQRVWPLARRAFTPTSRNAPVRHMAFGVPGGSSNMTYFVLCGGGLTAAVVYAYKTVSGDSERYEDRLANMGSTAKASEAAAPVAESTMAEEMAPATDVVAESVPALAEPLMEISAEPVTEASSEVASADASSEVASADASSEVASADAVLKEAVEPVVEEEAASPVAIEALPDGTPVTVEVAAMEEVPAEVPAAESVGMAAVDEVAPAPPAEEVAAPVAEVAA